MAALEQTYIGEELDLFARARRWKTYVFDLIAAELGGEVLEVGAGIGGTTRRFCERKAARWVCLEPDRTLAERILASIDRGELPDRCEVRVGTVAEIEPNERFDAILYIDVLEHIEDDRLELARASRRLRRGGSLIVLSPACPGLFSAFDRAVGHYRRYSRRSLAQAAPAELETVRLIALDSVGMLASLANRRFLKQDLPTAGQIAVWDQWMIPFSRAIDPLLGRRVGKSVLGIWRKP